MPLKIKRDVDEELLQVGTRITQNTKDLLDALVCLVRPSTDRTGYLRNIIEEHCASAINNSNKAEVDRIIASLVANREAPPTKKRTK